jgi:hypothetical protein
MSQQNLYPPIESGEPSAPTDYTPTPGAEPVSNVDEDVIQAGLTKFKSISRAFQLHLLIAFSVCSILFFIWHWSVEPNPQEGFWWWVYPFFFFAMTLSAHYFFGAKQYYEGVLALVVIANVMMFMTWGLTKSTGWWFIFPMFGSAMILVIIQRLITGSKTWFQVITHEYALLNGMLFLTWLTFGQGFPWFIYPLFLLALPLIVYRLKYVHNETRTWVLVGVVLLDINIVLFLTWGFTNVAFPWWPFPAAASLALVVWLYMRWKNGVGQFERVGNYNPSQVYEPVGNTPQQAPQYFVAPDGDAVAEVYPPYNSATNV